MPNLSVSIFFSGERESDAPFVHRITVAGGPQGPSSSSATPVPLRDHCLGGYLGEAVLECVEVVLCPTGRPRSFLINQSIPIKVLLSRALHFVGTYVCLNHL